MKVCLVGPPTITEFDPRMATSEAVRLTAEYAPLGILTLAAILEARGFGPALIDLNREYYNFLKFAREGTSDFCRHAVQKLVEQSSELYGFSTICSTYPLTIRIAKGLKEARPTAKVILGGPQASVVHTQTMEAFPWIDLILRGEADETFPALLDSLDRGSSWQTILGLTFRTNNGVVVNPNAPPVSSLDELPLPAFHSYDLSRCRYVSLELGRGCPFACRFCSTNDFFRRNFRLRSPESLLRQMHAVHSRYGVKRFDLVHDMFTVDRKRVVKFCETMLNSGEEFTWHCSARTDCIDDDLIRLMAKAGCRGIFFGVETGSQRMQTVINKKLDLSQVLPRVACANRHGIGTAFSLITCFPEETEEDFRQTVGILIDALRYDYVEPQLHLVAPLAETPIHTRFRNRLRLDGIFSDMSHQGWEQDPEDELLIAKYPEIFPNFYAVPTLLNRAYVKHFRDFVLHAMSRFRWLVVALADFTGDFIPVFDDWQRWLRTTRGQNAPVARYYGLPEFGTDFLEFCTQKFACSQNGWPTVVGALIEYEKWLHRLPDRGNGGSRVEPGGTRLDRQTIPVIARGVRIGRFPFNYLGIIRRLRRKKAPKKPRPCPVFLALKESADTNRIGTMQLPDAAGQLLMLCDGERNVADIIRQFDPPAGLIEGVSKQAQCLFGLEQLRKEGLISPTMGVG